MFSFVFSALPLDLMSGSWKNSKDPFNFMSLHTTFFVKEILINTKKAAFIHPLSKFELVASKILNNISAYDKQ